MNGLEALQALKNGQIVMKWRGKSHDIDRLDLFFCYRNKDAEGDVRISGELWMKYRFEWAWHSCDLPTEFWIRAEDWEFEITKANPALEEIREDVCLLLCKDQKHTTELLGILGKLDRLMASPSWRVLE